MGLFNSIRLGSSAAEDYEIERSLRFNKGDSPNLFRDGGSEGNRKTFTLSVWIKRSSRGEHSFWDFYTNDSNRTIFQLYFGNLRLFSRVGGSTQISCSTDLELRDFSAWYHFVYAVDTTQGTQANRVKMYINGVQQTVSGTLPSQNADTFVGSTNENRIGCQHDSAGNEAFFDGYMAEFNYIDGQQLTPSSFAETDTTTGEYKPIKYSGSYGTRGYYLNFSDNSGTTATTLGKDTSGNGNNLTPNNLSTYDSVPDSPSNNFCTINLNDKSTSTSLTTSNGNLKVSTTHGFRTARATFGLSSGKWYWEARLISWASSFIGITDTEEDITSTSRGGESSNSAMIRQNNGDIRTSGSSSSYGNSQSNGDILGFALDMDNGKFYIAENGTWYNSGDPVNGTNAAKTGLTAMVSPSAGPYDNRSCYFNFGQDDTFDGNETSQGNTDANGLGKFKYAPPTGFKALCSKNLPDPSIKLPDKHFDTLLYTGTDTSANRTISGLEFSPDLVWQKRRNGTNWHTLMDTVRGAGKTLFANDGSTEASNNQYGYVSAFTSDGYTWSAGSTNNSDGNETNGTFVSWNWKGGGSASSNSDGSLTSSVSANTTAGFSVGTFTAQSSGSATVGHGLGVAPDVVITKSRTSASNWYIYHKSIGENGWILLDSDAVATTGNSAVWNPAPTSSVFTYGSGLVNQGDIVFYAFSSVAGYSKFGSYTPNQNDDGPFVYTGFRPRWIMIKSTGYIYGGGSPFSGNWYILDTARDTFNVATTTLAPNQNYADSTGWDPDGVMDILSNGFKIRTDSLAINATLASSFIYFAFAETPFKYSRAR